MIFDKDPQTDVFNEWLRTYGIYIAIAVAGVIFLTVLILFIISIVKRKKNPELYIPSSEAKPHNNLEILNALGGASNILSHSLNGSRIVLILNNYDVIDEKKLNEAGIDSIIKMSTKITLVVKKNASKIYKELFH